MRRTAAVSYALLLAYLLAAPAPLSPFGDSGLQTEEVLDRTLSGSLQHVIAYAVLAAVLYWGFRPPDRRSQLGIIVWAGLHGIVFEAIQYFVPLRFCDGFDLFCNLLGVALGFVLVNRLFAMLGPGANEPLPLKLTGETTRSS